MKKLSTLLFFIVLSLTVWSYDFSVGQLCYNILSETEVEVTYEGYGSLGAYGDTFDLLTIPSTVTNNGITYTVTRIGDGAFQDCTTLTSVVIPNSVTDIGGSTFYGCISLIKMTILATTPPAMSNVNGTFHHVDLLPISLYVPTESIDAYRATEWNAFNILPIEALTHKQLEVTITGNGIIQYGETTLTEDGTLYIEPETEVSLKLLPDDGFEIVQVMYNGTDYSSNVNADGILLLSAMEENASLDVSFQPIDTSNELCITDANQRVVFFKAPQSYNSDVYVYMWKDNGFVGEYELTPSWPGTQAISQGDGYYRFYIPESWGEPEADWMIIWSDGKGSGHLDGQQTEDLPFTMRALYAGSSFMDTRETGIVSGLCDEGGVQHLATIYIEGGDGNLLFGETQISSGSAMLIPSNGTFTLTAPAGYSIVTATVNGEAFYEVENGQSVVVSNITGDIDLYVTLESLHYRMSVYYEGSTVYTWYIIGHMMDFTCNIAAMEGYQLQSVTLNGEDVTSLLDGEGRLDITNITEDKTLIISSSQNGGTTNYVSSDVNRLRAWQAGENIFVEVDETVQSVMLYDVTGRLMQEYQHMGGYQVITMPVKNLVNLLKVVGKDGSVVAHKLM